MANRMSYLLFVVVSLIAVAWADDLVTASSITLGAVNCAALAILLPGRVQTPRSPGYVYEASSYFAAFENEVSPACFIQPRTAQDVALIINFVRVLPPAVQPRLAIRGGGHTAWAGSANVEQGITIDLSNLTTITVDTKSNVASIGIGNRWENVYATLAQQGLAVSGGRVGKVGVGGLTLGGGLSYFSARRGWVADSVVNFEIVLSTGNIVQANAKTNADLFAALKGGSNNFGVVTRIDMTTFKQGDMWGGTILYLPSAMSSLYAAFVNFALSTTQDLNAHLIFASVWIQGLGEIESTNLYYDNATVNPPVFQPFTSIQPQIQNTQRIDSLSGLAAEQTALSTNGDRQWFFTTSFRVDRQFMLDIRNYWLDTVNAIQTDLVSLALVFHPISKELLTASQKLGPNALGLDVSDGPFVVCLLDSIHTSSSADAKVSAAIMALIAKIDAEATRRRLNTRYKFLNYAYGDQKVLQSYGASSVAKLSAVSKKYDPQQFFQKVVPGGFKISQAA